MIVLCPVLLEHWNFIELDLLKVVIQINKLLNTFTVNNFNGLVINPSKSLTNRKESIIAR